jgi:hypothetical protein
MEVGMGTMIFLMNEWGQASVPAHQIVSFADSLF